MDEHDKKDNRFSAPGGQDKNDKRFKGPDEQDEKDNRFSGLEALALCSQLGLTLALPIVLGAVAGHWLDKKFSTGMIFLILLIVMGIAAGLAGAYRQITSVTKIKRKP